MKRITYISRFARDLSVTEIEALGEDAWKRNAVCGVTGFLVCSGGFFFQVIEGESSRMDELFATIRADRRHRDVVCLKAESDVRERLFPDWAMRVIQLDEMSEPLMRPIRSLFLALAESHAGLRRYTQPAVLRFLDEGINPLDVPPRREERAVLFCDLVGFSKISSVLPVEKVVVLVNVYLEAVTRAVSRNGGEVTKITGDGAMAYFPKEKGDEALVAAVEVLSSIQDLREASPAGGLSRLIHCGIGMDCGTVLEGNVMSEIKADYTIMGQVVNRAAAIEPLTRRLGRALLFSREFARSLVRDWPIISMGEQRIKQETSPAPLFSLDHPATIPAFGAQPYAFMDSVLAETLQEQSDPGVPPENR